MNSNSGMMNNNNGAASGQKEDYIDKGMSISEAMKTY